MEPVVSAQSVRDAEAAWFAAHPGGDLMAVAARAVADVVAEQLDAVGARRVLVVAGPGNNAGDALFAAVAMNAVRRLADDVFVHMHTLSLRYHLERKTGALTRVLERGRCQRPARPRAWRRLQRLRRTGPHRQGHAEPRARGSRGQPRRCRSAEVAGRG